MLSIHFTDTLSVDDGLSEVSNETLEFYRSDEVPHTHPTVSKQETNA